MRPDTVSLELTPGVEAPPVVVPNHLKYFTELDKKVLDVPNTRKRFEYLLGLTGLFGQFIESRAEKDPRIRAILEDIASDHDRKAAARKGVNSRLRKTEKEEDRELLDDEAHLSQIMEFTSSPGYIKAGTMRDYQLQGLNWLILLHENNLLGILADEMGLGKTLQTIAFLGWLRYYKHVNGPHIVITPKLTLDNWAREFNRWTPEVKVLVVQGDKDQRAAMLRDSVLTCEFDVVIALYEIVIKEKATFRKFDWQYIVIDEAHRIKNEELLLLQIIRMFHLRHRLLITGTPLQNNLRELWALLNFILPDVFSDADTFDQHFKDGAGNDEVVAQLHKVLQPFLLRRIKADVERLLLPKQEMNVYFGLSLMQQQWYKKILEKDLDAVNGVNGKKELKTRLLNIVMQLRKCCNHPYLFEGAEPGPPYTNGEHLVFNLKKMVFLDKLLKKFKENGLRVLIFSQMLRMLDILEDYCFLREYQYCRIDGQTDHADRVNAIDEYNAPGSEKFVFLLTTRAGGLGINLTTADVVILFDSDWNPQADLQAMDRAHRIGQTKQVKVFRLITEGAVEEKVLERATQKLKLDQLVIQLGRTLVAGLDGQQLNKAASRGELLDLVQFGAKDIFESLEKDDEAEELDIEEILKASLEKTRQLNDRYDKLDLGALQNFTNDGLVYEWNGENFKKALLLLKIAGGQWIQPAKRERKENYLIDLYYKDVLNPGAKLTTQTAALVVNKNGPRPPKQLNIYDHQFYLPKLFELYELEKSYYKKQTGYKVPLKAGKADTKAQREADQRLEQEEIENSRPLTDDEKQLKEQLLTEGFSNWNRRDFQHFILVCTKYGRNLIALIAHEFPEKTIDEVREYAKAFWQNYREIDGFERFLNQIEQGEEKIVKVQLHKEALRRKMAQYKYPLQELTLKYPPAATNKRVFSDEEDRFLLVQLYRFGLDLPDVYERIRQAIKQLPLFQFDFFFQLRNLGELSRRCLTLLACVYKEMHPEQIAGTKRKHGK